MSLSVLKLECSVCGSRFSHSLECDGYVCSCAVVCPKCDKIRFCILVDSAVCESSYVHAKSQD